MELFSKPFYMASAEGEVRVPSEEEALGRGLTRWKGWLCSAGSENLHISPDGNVYVATCKVGGIIGNVYDGHLQIPGDWIVCSKDCCSCGTDMKLAKARKSEFVANCATEMVKNFKLNPDLQKADWVAPLPFGLAARFPLSCTWDIGRRCNFSCTYCNPYVSNHFESHKSLGSLKTAYSLIESHFCKGRRCKFIFTGGEPTLNPAYLEFVSMLYSFGHSIHTTTNGSRPAEYLCELLKSSHIGFSYHFDNAKLEHFVDVISALIEAKKSDHVLSWRWVGVRIMVPPGRVHDAIEVRQRLMQIPGFEEQQIQMHLSPVFDPQNSSMLQPYEPRELETLNQFA